MVEKAVTGTGWYELLRQEGARARARMQDLADSSRNARALLKDSEKTTALFKSITKSGQQRSK